MIKKVFLNTAFGTPFDWTDKFIDNVQGLEKYGWYWKIFTPNKIKSKGNVEIVNMDIDEFNSRIEKATGINPHNYIDGFCPHKLVSDYYPAHGVIFPDYAEGFDYWGHCNWDVVYGRLEKWLPDEFFEDCDIFGNDPDAINGVFSLYKNEKRINELFKQSPVWEAAFSDLERLYTFDEKKFAELVRQVRDKGEIKFKSAFWQENDHQDIHRNSPKLKLDGRKLLNSITGEEMMIFHFSGKKVWPIS